MKAIQLDNHSQYVLELALHIQSMQKMPISLRHKPETKYYMKELKMELRNFTGLTYSKSTLKRLQSTNNQRSN